ncbi:MAG: helix-turn-helix transcriptional regulator [Roseburia sp.]|nr:helix-turn-helix transcriptional regulator [Roseburia sp.]
MIDFGPFWQTLQTSDETTYTLINRHHISSATIDKLRKNKPITTTTINDLCRILKCNIQDIATYIPSEDDQIL